MILIIEAPAYFVLRSYVGGHIERRLKLLDALFTNLHILVCIADCLV